MHASSPRVRAAGEGPEQNQRTGEEGAVRAAIAVLEKMNLERANRPAGKTDEVGKTKGELVTVGLT